MAVELEDLVSLLRPVGVGTALEVPEAFRAIFKAIAVFPDGSVGVQWHDPQLATFSSANTEGAIESITSDVVMVGKVLYVKVHK